MAQQRTQAIAAAVFCPQNKPPTAEYMATLRRFLRGNPSMEPFVQAIMDLPDTWKTFSRESPSLAKLEQGSSYTKDFRNWLTDDIPIPMPEILSGILALPLLTITQTVQYFQYLGLRGLSHSEFLEETKVGGAQGFCGGLLPAIAIAASRNEAEVLQNACKSLRLALGIGAYGELGDDETTPGPTTLVLRTKYEGQADEVAARFPGALVSAITDPLSTSIVGPVKVLQELKSYAEAEGLPVSQVNLRGKVHNPENQDLAAELCQVCDKYPDLLGLPWSDTLQVPVRSNSTGEILVSGVALSHEIAYSTLVTRCEWYTLMGAVSRALNSAEANKPGVINEHTFAMFGTGRKNCIPAAPFEENGIKITKLDVPRTVAAAPTNPSPSVSAEFYADDAIAIVGCACRLPGANSIDELWDLLSNGSSAAQLLPLQRVDSSASYRVGLDAKRPSDSQFYANLVADVDAFDNTFFGISPREAKYMDPQQRLLLETAYEALDSSGYLRHHLRENFDNVGCFVGTTYTEYLENTTAYGATAFGATGTIRAFQNGKISYNFGWSGPSEAIDTACSSSLVAIHRACRAIQAGECPMALAGGCNIITGIQNFVDLGKAGFLSPTGQCKPFDEAADGYCRADGVGLVVLKSLRQAVSDGDDILGVIPAISTNHGGLSSSITVPHSRAQVDLFGRVIQRSGIKPHHVTYVEAHGTGTQVGDPIEIASIGRVLAGTNREAGELLNVGSLKANVGHSETAAGVGSLLKVLAMMKHRRTPPLAGFKTLNPKIPALELGNLKITNETLDWDVPFRAALVSSYGAAGSNAALVCCEPPRSHGNGNAGVVSGSESQEGMKYPILLTAATIASLKATALKLGDYIQKTKDIPESPLSIGNVAFTLSEKRKHHPVRWMVEAGDLDSLVDDLRTLGHGDDQNSHLLQTEPVATKPVVLLFSGQSKTTINLDPSWFAWFPRLRFHINHCDDIFRALGYPSFQSALFQSEPISDVVVLQCGTFAVQYSFAQLWIDAGVEIDAVLGHSFGELTAMVVAGTISLEDGVKLVAARASLMKEMWGPERGSMLAIHAAPDVVREVIAAVHNGTGQAKGVSASDASRGLEIACYNSPTSQVVVGTAEGIEMAERVLNENTAFNGIKHQRVAVTHGFHSVFTEPLLEDLGAVANSLVFNHPVRSLETATEQATAPGGITANRIVEHTRAPVYFDHAVKRLEQRLGSCVWLEAGAGSPILSMAKRCTQSGSGHVFIPVDAKNNKNAVSSFVIALHEHGIPFTFPPFLSPKESGLRQVWLPPYQFEKKRFWLDWIDPVTEHRKTLPGQQAGVENAMLSVPASLVTPIGTASDSWAALNFAVHTSTPRFTDIVSGHALRGHPLCPASMYMECVVMAAQMIKPELSDCAFRWDNISFQGALGLSRDRHVSMALEGAGDYLTWNFAFSSLPNAGPRTSVSQGSNGSSKPRPTAHAKGRFGITSRSDLSLLGRVMMDRIQQLLADPRAEHLNANLAYSLFSRVITYSAALRGIERMTIIDNTYAVAEVHRPAIPVSRAETTAARLCDTVALDTFIQVLGLLIVSSGKAPAGDVFIATDIGSIVMQDCDFDKCDSWTVYAALSTIEPADGEGATTASSPTTMAGDLLVFTKGGKLVLTGSDIRFTRFSVEKLEKLLIRASEPVPHPVVKKEDEKVLMATDTLAPVAQSSTMVSEALSTILRAENIKNLGLDSMAANYLSRALHQVSTKDPVFTQPPTPPILDTDEVAIKVGQEPTPESAHRVASLQHRILEIIAENSGMPSTDVDNGACIADMGLDSLSIVELLSALEDSFAVRLGKDELGLHSTVKEIVDYVDLHAVQVLG